MISPVDVAMLGARMHYAIPSFLAEAEVLGTFFTDFYFGGNRRVQRACEILAGHLHIESISRMLGRQHSSIPPSSVESFDLLGYSSFLRRKITNSSMDIDALYSDLGMKFGAMVIASGRLNAPVIWGFNTAAVEIFEESKSRNAKCILEQTIIPTYIQRQILSGVEGYVGYATEKDYRSPLIEREREEWRIADAIVVGSEFVKGGLVELGVAAGKIHVIPYGVSESRFPGIDRSARVGGNLRCLFVGEIGYRKGASDLLKALSLVTSDKLELLMAGEVTLSDRAILSSDSRVRVLGPIPRNRISELYQWADVLILPTYAEGSATVTYEALMSGIPVITTPNSGSLVEDGVDGFIVPAGEISAIAHHINIYLEDRELLAFHQLNALEARKKVGLDQYKSNVLNLVGLLG